MKITTTKRLIARLGAASASIGLFLSATTARALDFANVRDNVSGIATDTNILDTVFRVINWILLVTAAIAVAFLIIGGFRYIVSAGNENQVEEAKATMTYAILGLVIVLLAFVIGATINTIILGQQA